MNRTEALDELDSLITEGKDVLATSYFANGVFGGPFVDGGKFSAWRARTQLILREVLPVSQQGELNSLSEKNGHLTSLAEKWQALLEATQNGVDRELISKNDDHSVSNNIINTDNIIVHILSSFSRVLSSINDRHAGRDGFRVEDEYDVQDLLRSLLVAFFDDVRDEEQVPSFAGGGTRVDLYLKNEKRFIEVKMTSSAARDRQVGNQLTSDIPHYKKHPGCEKLYCFVFDPGQHLKNPAGLKADLEEVDEGFVTVVICS